MKLNVFEGFKRLNVVVQILILIIGICISYNQDGRASFDKYYYQVAGVCNVQHMHSFKINFGYVDVTYCFDKEYYYSDREDFVRDNKFSDEMLSEYQEKVFEDWLKKSGENLGFTFLIMLIYFIFCKITKFVITGFIKN